MSEEEDIMTSPPTLRSHRPALSDKRQKTYSYNLSPNPELIKTMPYTTPKTFKSTEPAEEIGGKGDGSLHETTIYSTSHPSTSRVTDAMKKYTYAMRTTAPPSHLIRNNLPETPSSYYQYSDSRTGLPQVKSLPPLGARYPAPLPHAKVCSNYLDLYS